MLSYLIPLAILFALAAIIVVAPTVARARLMCGDCHTTFHSVDELVAHAEILHDWSER